MQSSRPVEMDALVNKAKPQQSGRPNGRRRIPFVRPGRGLLAIVLGAIILALAGSAPGDIGRAKAASSPASRTRTMVRAAGSGPKIGWGGQIYLDPLANSLTTISCSGSHFCAAVDGVGNAFTFDGHGWTRYRDVDSSTGGFESVACGSPTSCWAADGQGFAVHFNGRVWSSPVRIDRPRAAGYSVLHIDLACPTAGFCAGVDVNGMGLIWRHGHWSRGVVDGIDTFYSIGCGSPTFCMAAEHSGRAATWNGSRWSASHATHATDGLSTVACWRNRICVAGSDFGEAEVWRTGHWSPIQTLGAGVGMVGAACFGSTRCVMVNTHGQLLVWTGSRWLMGAGVTEASPNALSCASSEFCAVISPTDAGGYVYFRAPAPAVTTRSLPGATRHSAYHAKLHARFGTSPYRWHVESGSLPRGLKFTPGGLIEGTPAKAGTWRLRVAAVDPMREKGMRGLVLRVRK